MLASRTVQGGSGWMGEDGGGGGGGGGRGFSHLPGRL